MGLERVTDVAIIAQCGTRQPEAEIGEYPEYACQQINKRHTRVDGLVERARTNEEIEGTMEVCALVSATDRQATSISTIDMGRSSESSQELVNLGCGGVRQWRDGVFGSAGCGIGLRTHSLGSQQSQYRYLIPFVLLRKREGRKEKKARWDREPRLTSKFGDQGEERMTPVRMLRMRIPWTQTYFLVASALASLWLDLAYLPTFEYVVSSILAIIDMVIHKSVSKSVNVL